jgi:hypothetical protein
VINFAIRRGFNCLHQIHGVHTISINIKVFDLSFQDRCHTSGEAVPTRAMFGLVNGRHASILSPRFRGVKASEAITLFESFALQ